MLYTSTSANWGLVVEAFTPAASTTSSATVSHSAIDQGQSVTITDTVTPSLATGTVAFQVSTNSGSTWSALGSPQTLTGGAASYSYSPSVGSYQYNAIYSGDPNYLGSTSTVASLTVNSVLVAPVVQASAGAVDQSQSTTLSVKTDISGGTSSFSYQWFEEAQGASQFSTVGSATSSAQSYPFSTTGSTTVGTYKFELQVTDSAGTPMTVTSNVLSITVNSALVAPTASASPTTVDAGQSVSLSVPTPTTGTSSYTYDLAGEF